MFNTQSTTDRTGNNSFVTKDGATAMLDMSISVNNRIRTLAAAIAVIAVALFSTATSASAFVGFTPDGVNWVPGPDTAQVAGFTPDGVNQVKAIGDPTIVRAQVLAYMNGGNHTPDGVNNLTGSGAPSPVVATFTPDGVNQVENVDGPAIVRAQVLAYMNGGNHSPDGVSNIGDAVRDSSDVTNLAYFYAGIIDPSYVG